jgi:hypothetical protein
VIVIATGIGLAMFPIWYRLGRKLVGLVRTRRSLEATS